MCASFRNSFLAQRGGLLCANEGLTADGDRHEANDTGHYPRKFLTVVALIS
jgi:hypothetical protein